MPMKAGPFTSLPDASDCMLLITFSQVHSGTCGGYSEMLSKSIIKYCNRGIS